MPKRGLFRPLFSQDTLTRRARTPTHDALKSLLAHSLERVSLESLPGSEEATIRGRLLARLILEGSELDGTCVVGRLREAILRVKSLVAIVPVHERGGMEGDVQELLVGKRPLVRRKDVPKGRVLLVQNEGEKVVSRVEPVST